MGRHVRSGIDEVQKSPKRSKRPKLTKFANYEKFVFKQSKIQTFSNYISVFTIIGSLLYLTWYLIIFIYNFRKKY